MTPTVAARATGTALPLIGASPEDAAPDTVGTITAAGTGSDSFLAQEGRTLPVREPGNNSPPVEFSDVCVVPGQAGILITPAPTSDPHIWDPEDNVTPAELPGFWIIPGQAHVVLVHEHDGTTPKPSTGSLDIEPRVNPEVPDKTWNSAFWKPSGCRVLPPQPRTPSTLLADLLYKSMSPESSRRKEWRSSWQLLAQRDFRLYFLGSLVSNLGTWLQSTAQVLIAYQVTHSVFTVGLIASAQFAGMIAVSPWAAVLADKFSPRAVLIGTQFASASIAGWMACRYVSGTLGVHSLVFGALGLGSAYSLALPVQTALVPGLVSDADATDAVKMNSVSYNAGRAVAPALCVLLIAVAGPYLIFALNAISFVVFAMVLRKLRDVANDIALHLVLAAILRRVIRLTGGMSLRVIRACTPGRLARGIANPLLIMAFTVALAQPGTTALETRPKASPGRPRARVTDGVIIALHNRRILLLLAIVAAVTLADDPILVLSPALAHTTLDTSTQWAGYFIAALGWGSVLGSLPPTYAEHNARHASRRAALALLILGISIIVFAAGFSTSVSLAAAFIAGGAGLFTGAAAQTALLRHQRKTGASLANVASIAALWAIAWAGSKPFASLADGWLGSHVGILPTCLILATPAITIAFGELLLPRRIKSGINIWARKALPHVIPGPEFSPSPLRVQKTAITTPHRPSFAMSKDGLGSQDQQTAGRGTPSAGIKVSTRTPIPSRRYWDPCDSGGLSESLPQDALRDAVPQGT